MDILEALWLGQIAPIEETNKNAEAYDKVLSRLIEQQKILKSMLPEGACSILADYNDCQIELQDYAERTAFSKGFCLGAKLMMAVLKVK